MPAPTLGREAGAANRQALGHGGAGVVSREAQSAARTLLEAPVAVRRELLAGLSGRERAHVFRETLRETGSIYGQWYDTPSGFAEDVIGETVWGLQKQVMDSVALPGVKRVAVPAGFGVGKTFLAGRMVSWAGAVNPVGSIVIVTTATRMRQVANQLWPHIKTAVAKAGLPGRLDTVQWVAPDHYGNSVRISYGFSAAPNDEAAMQGIHGTPKLLLIVDEAGGIARLIGAGTNNLLTGDAKLLAIGNPAMNDPGSWFEELVEEGEGDRVESTISIRIASTDSPAITGEATPICRACVPNFDGHTIAGGNPSHLPDWEWLIRTLRDYGAQIPENPTLDEVREVLASDGIHPYLTAKVAARFPRDGGNKVIPASWVELGLRMDEPVEGGHLAALNADSLGRARPAATTGRYHRLRDLDLPGEEDEWMVKEGAWVRLGVDVAAGGGDEFAIYRSVGDLLQERHVSSGSVNADSVKVGEVVLQHIYAAERLAARLGTRQPVRVKIDTIGVGWGVVGHLQRLADTKKHSAQIVPVHVGEGIDESRVDESAEMRPDRKRDEMWLAGRELLQPDVNGNGRLRLRMKPAAAAQLSNPNLGFTKNGKVKVESKDSMKARGIHSPDRAEAALLAIYEPFPIETMKRRGLL